MGKPAAYDDAETDRCSLLLLVLSPLIHSVERNQKEVGQERHRVTAELLDAREAEALIEFDLAAKKCLSRLSGQTISDVGREYTRHMEMPKHSKSMNEKECTRENVGELFDRFDTDRDGILSISEFRTAFNQLTSGSFNEEQVESLIAAADINTDGKIDIHEFALWLYGESQPCRADKTNPTEGLRKRIEELEAELRMKSRALDDLEEQQEEEMAATHDFWRSIAKHAILTIDAKVDLQTSEWLGNGKYGFVLKANRLRDRRDVVVKMMGLRWAHLAVKEWKNGSLVGSHPNVVEYEDVMLHSDQDKSITRMLMEGYETGKLRSRTKRSKFPDRYICLTQELMNRGTVQDWLDDELLMPGGMLCVMRSVACALAFMHDNGVTHNDIKPENVMLHQESEEGKDSRVIVKLGDLGLADKSTNTSADYSQYGMTTFCMITGERFGTRKYRPESIDGFVEEAKQACCSFDCGEGDDLGKALRELPDVLGGVFRGTLQMSEVSKLPCLQSWGFFHGDGCRRAGGKSVHCETVKLDLLKEATATHHVERMGGRRSAITE